MWHEARKQERLIRGLIVDYRRRAERRRDFYDKINADSTQILQVHGRPCKIHLEPAIAAAGDSASIMMPWQGDHSNVIDRFDVRAHLDIIPEVKNRDIATENLSQEERNCNYERYRILAQNIFLGISEEKFLHQLAIEEQFGVTLEEKELQKEKLHEKNKVHGATIGYNYDDSSAKPFDPKSIASSNATTNNDDKDDSEEESDLEILDVDLSIDVNKVEPTQAHAMNACGTQFGMLDTDLFSFLTGDAQEAERHRQLMREEKEKALFSGRKSRRQRRAHRDKLLATRVVSPPHYAARPSPVRHAGHESPSPTRSLSPPEQNSNVVTYITSFGGDDDHPPDLGKVLPNKITYADKVKATVEPKIHGTLPRDVPKKNLKRSLSPRRPRRSPYGRTRRSWSRGRTSRSSRSHGSKSRGYRSKSRNRTRSRSAERGHYSYSDRSSRSHSRHRRTSSSSDSSRSSRSSSQSSSDRRNSNSKFNNTKTTKSPERGHSSGVNVTCAPTVRPPRYYGRKREGCKSSSSELSVDSSDDQSNTTDKMNENLVGSKTSQVSNIVRSSGSASKLSAGSNEKLSLKERLRRKMQAQLSRQLRADKKAEAERLEREQQMQQERDDEMREMAIKIRRRQREMRHQRRASYSSPDSDDSSTSPNRSSPRSPARSSRSPARSSPRYQRKKSLDREDKKKYDESPPRKIRDKGRVWENESERQFEGPQNECSSTDRDRYSNPRNKEDVEKMPEKSYNRFGSHSRSSFSGSGRNTFENRDYDSKNSQDSKYRDLCKNRNAEERSYYDRSYVDSSRKSEDDHSSRRHGRNESHDSKTVTTKAPIKRLVDY
ncbi:uncharacterized protein LOC143916059 [Arctopsyche grandis]|uniref:uncharacterized protein LOC143916059 n=1 Tax=Arctopsyche grandis TaxID=121162 RepID=UPI00406DA44D